jgi:hypothetical protein
VEAAHEFLSMESEQEWGLRSDGIVKLVDENLPASHYIVVIIPGY